VGIANSTRTAAGKTRWNPTFARRRPWISTRHPAGKGKRAENAQNRLSRVPFGLACTWRNPLPAKLVTQAANGPHERLASGRFQPVTSLRKPPWRLAIVSTLPIIIQAFWEHPSGRGPRPAPDRASAQPSSRPHRACVKQARAGATPDQLGRSPAMGSKIIPNRQKKWSKPVL